MIGAQKSIVDAQRARCRLRTGVAGRCLRSRMLEVVRFDDGWIGIRIVCRELLRLRGKAFYDAVLGVGGGACVIGAMVEASLLVGSLASGCWAES